MSRRAVFYRVLSIGFNVYALSMLGVHLSSFWPPLTEAVENAGTSISALEILLAQLTPALILIIALFANAGEPEAPKGVLRRRLLTVLVSPTFIVFLVGLGYSVWWWYLGYGLAFGVPEGKVYEIRAWSALNLLTGWVWARQFRQRYMAARGLGLSKSSAGS